MLWRGLAAFMAVPLLMLVIEEEPDAWALAQSIGIVLGAACLGDLPALVTDTDSDWASASTAGSPAIGSMKPSLCRGHASFHRYASLCACLSQDKDIGFSYFEIKNRIYIL